LLVVGPEPPPFTGMEVAMQALVAELRRASVPYLRIDTADPTDKLGNRGRWTFHNVCGAFGHIVTAVRRMNRKDVAAVYVPIAQEFPALLRDLAFIALARLAKKPVAIHLHGGAFAEFYNSNPRGVRWIIRTVMHGASAGIVLTDRLRPALECVLPASRITVVPNGIDLQRIDDIERGEDENAITVLFLSSLFPSKGVLVFIQALSLARKIEPALHGVIAGSWLTPEMRDNAVALVRRLSLEEAVDFVGPVEGAEKTGLLRRADIFCFPSFYPLEGQPLVVIEAMAAGLPVVATAWRGIADTVVDGETGFLVDKPLPELVAERVVYLAKNAEERARMGAAAQTRYERLYTQRAFGVRMVRVLLPLLDEEPSRSSSLAQERTT
jgi:glycosyltransferase involved in cell wall biosynthesis